MHIYLFNQTNVDAPPDVLEDSDLVQDLDTLNVLVPNASGTPTNLVLIVMPNGNSINTTQYILRKHLKLIVVPQVSTVLQVIITLTRAILLKMLSQFVF